MDDGGKKNLAAQSLTNDPSTFAGYLRKYNPRGKVQNRYCIIHNGIFYYYKDPESYKPQGYFKMSGYQAHKGKEITNEPPTYMFKMEHHTNKAMREYVFRGASNRDQNMWVEKINKTVIEVFPDSLYSIENTPSLDYDYISTDDVINTLPQEFLSRKKIMGSNFKGPKYNLKACGSAPRWHPDDPEATPDVPERTLQMNALQMNTLQMNTLQMNMQPPQPQGYMSLDRDSTIPGHDVRKSWGRQDHVDNDDDDRADLSSQINTMTDNYIPMGKIKMDDNNSMSENYEPMFSIHDAEQESIDRTESESECPYVDLIGSDYEEEDDEDCLDDELEFPRIPSKEGCSSKTMPNLISQGFIAELNERNKGKTLPCTLNASQAPSQNIDSISDKDADNDYEGSYTIMDDGMEHLGKSRSKSLVAPEEHLKHHFHRTVTFPIYSNEIIEENSTEFSIRLPIAPPVTPRNPRHKVQQPDINKLTDHDVMPKSCMHANVQREQCLKLLSPFEVGTYFIRTAREDGKDALALLSRKNPPKVKHYIVFESAEGQRYLEKEEPKFDFLTALIKYYYINFLPQTEIKLTCPLSSRSGSGNASPIIHRKANQCIQRSMEESGYV